MYVISLEDGKKNDFRYQKSTRHPFSSLQNQKKRREKKKGESIRQLTETSMLSSNMYDRIQ